MINSTVSCLGGSFLEGRNSISLTSTSLASILTSGSFIQYIVKLIYPKRLLNDYYFPGIIRATGFRGIIKIVSCLSWGLIFVQKVIQYWRNKWMHLKGSYGQYTERGWVRIYPSNLWNKIHSGYYRWILERNVAVRSYIPTHLGSTRVFHRLPSFLLWIALLCSSLLYHRPALMDII